MNSIITHKHRESLIQYVEMCPEEIAGAVKTALTGKQRVSHFQNVGKLNQKIIHHYLYLPKLQQLEAYHLIKQLDTYQLLQELEAQPDTYVLQQQLDGYHLP